MAECGTCFAQYAPHSIPEAKRSALCLGEKLQVQVVSSINSRHCAGRPGSWAPVPPDFETGAAGETGKERLTSDNARNACRYETPSMLGIEGDTLLPFSPQSNTAEYISGG